MTAITKLATIVSALAADATAEDIANKIKSRKKADLKVANFTMSSLTVKTDEGTEVVIANKNDAGFNQFIAYLKGKSSVLLPKYTLVQELPGYNFYQVESLAPLASVIGEDNVAFSNWLNRYAASRKTGRAVRGTKDEAAPAAVTGLVHVGNLRGLVNKLVQFDVNAEMDFSNFSVRDTDGVKQIVVNLPFA